MLTTKNTKTISDMRLNAPQLLDQVAKSQEALYIFYKSRPKAVLLSLSKYQYLLDIFEDYLDSQEAKEFEKKNKKKINWLSEKEFLS